MTFSTNKLSPRVLVDPRFAIEWRDIMDFLGEFGPFNGRYVPRYPINWTSQVREHVDDLSTDSLGPVRKQAIIEKIRRDLQLCSTPINWEYLNSKTWSENVRDALHGIDGSIVVGNALEPEPFLPWAAALEAVRQTRKRSWPFYGTVAEYLDFCRPLLLNSPSAYLIDCYLDPFSNVAENFLKSLFALVKCYRCDSIEINNRRSAIGREAVQRH